MQIYNFRPLPSFSCQLEDLKFGFRYKKDYLGAYNLEFIIVCRLHKSVPQ